MGERKTSTVHFAFDITSGSNLCANKYAEGEVYDSSTLEFVANKDISQVNYNRASSSYVVSTNSSREHDSILGLNRRLKNINP